VKFKTRVNTYFVQHPRVGYYGYRLVRRLGLHPFSRETLHLLKRVRRLGFTPRTILDVGANAGEWSRSVKLVFPDANYVLIEPQVEMEPFLQRFCAENEGAAYFLAGAGAEPGKLTLTMWDDFAGSSFVLEPSAEMLASGKQREIPIVTIDALVETGKMAVPDLVKVDVQGFEREVLRGASCCFGKTELFILETSLFSGQAVKPLFHEMVQFMLERGYVVYDLVDRNYRPFDGALGQVDVCFVKRDGVFRQTTRWA
jgi:FkbM family methyltransferase